MISDSSMISLIKSSGSKILNESDFMSLKENLNLNRNLEVSTLLCDVRFEWWSNVGYAYISGAKFIFDDIEVNGNWPNNYKTNICLLRNGEKFAIIPTEEY